MSSEADVGARQTTQMMLANKTSRYDIAAHAVREGGKYNSEVQVVAHELASNFLHLKQKDKAYIDLHGMGEFFVS